MGIEGITGKTTKATSAAGVREGASYTKTKKFKEGQEVVNIDITQLSASKSA